MSNRGSQADPATYLLPEGLDALAWILAKEADDAYSDLRGHVIRVAANARRLADFVGLPPEEVDLIAFAARLHDVGKLQIPLAILAKPGRLTDEERVTMEQHAVLGRDMLARIPGVPKLVLDVARYHHERFDGFGYERLVGDDIPLAARIVQVADVYDALVSPRAYKAQMLEGVALSLMIADTAPPVFGRRNFDPALLRAFVSMRVSDPSASFDDVTRIQLSEFVHSLPELGADAPAASPRI